MRGRSERKENYAMSDQVSIAEIKEMGKLFRITDAVEMGELKNPEKLKTIFQFLAKDMGKTKRLGKVFGHPFDGTLPYLRKAVNICLIIRQSQGNNTSVEEIARKLWYEGFENEVTEPMKKYCIEETEPYLRQLESVNILKLISRNGVMYATFK